jgi:hypothetical protein
MGRRVLGFVSSLSIKMLLQQPDIEHFPFYSELCRMHAQMPKKIRKRMERKIGKDSTAKINSVLKILEIEKRDY